MIIAPTIERIIYDIEEGDNIGVKGVDIGGTLSDLSNRRLEIMG